MKPLSILLFVFFLISKISTEVEFSNYNTPEGLIDYIEYGSDFEYFTSNSLFFEFDFFLDEDEVTNILSTMTEIYDKYGLNGVFLILNTEAGISDIANYTEEFCKLLENEMEFEKDSMYVVVMEYTFDYNRITWDLKFSIKTGEYAKENLPDNEVEEIIDEFSETLKDCTYENVVELMDAISFVIQDNSYIP